MGGINDDQVKFSVGMAGITDPHELANHLKLLDMKILCPLARLIKMQQKHPRKTMRP
jgi:hypothetical protein